MDYQFDAVKAKNECVQWIREWFKANGSDCNAVLGISGGKDSTVAAALCVEALGKDRVVGVMMPDGFQSDIDDSIRVVQHLGIKAKLVDISDAVKAVRKSVFLSDNYNWKELTQASNQAILNLPPRIRMATLYFVSQSVNGRVVNTCNLSEDYIGYSTRWGDSVGDFAPLANFTSDEVIAIGEVLGLPHDLIYKTPSDGLCGKTDEDNFGFTYAVLNKYIRTGICDDEEIRKKIDAMHERNLFKLMPIPAFKYLPEVRAA